jgi:hypothetical protein
MKAYNQSTGEQFEVGDIVTRDGTDHHKVIEISDPSFFHVECIKAPETGWCAVGNREWNITRRYSFPDDLLIE